VAANPRFLPWLRSWNSSIALFPAALIKIVTPICPKNQAHPQTFMPGHPWTAGIRLVSRLEPKHLGKATFPHLDGCRGAGCFGVTPRLPQDSG